jgi:hypothetical protein
MEESIPSVNPTMRPFTALAISDPAGQAPALAQGQGRARPPRGLLAMRYAGREKDL